MLSVGYVSLILAHALCAIIGFGALAATGAYAQAVRSSRDPFSSETLRRFFRPGHNVASATIVAVPILGGCLLIAQHGQDLHLAYPWIGLACWGVAATVATTVVWPAERRLQSILAANNEDAPAVVAEESRGVLDTVARRCLTGASITTACFVVAVVVMLVQP
jgi:putative copper export protein